MDTLLIAYVYQKHGLTVKPYKTIKFKWVYSCFEHRNDRPGGGVSIFIRDDIKFKLRSDLSAFNTNFESISIEIESTEASLDKNSIVSLMYRIPNTDISFFNDYIEHTLSSVKLQNKIMYITGYFNINLLSSDNHIPTSQFIDIMFSAIKENS